jgi:hypothetical protein
MIRLILPAVIAASSAAAQESSICRNVPFSTKNCVRVLACVGDQGVTFDGQARGWDAGSVTGLMSDGAACHGTWNSNGPLGTGLSQLSCDDGTDIDVIYYNQDNITGTVIGQGQTSDGRAIRVWSGENVLQFLTPQGAFGPALPCVQGDIPIS